MAYGARRGAGRRGSGLTDIPRRIYLDTGTLQTMYDYGETLWENEPFEPLRRDRHVRRLSDEVDALRNIFLLVSSEGQKSVPTSTFNDPRFGNISRPSRPCPLSELSRDAAAIARRCSSMAGQLGHPFRNRDEYAGLPLGVGPGVLRAEVERHSQALPGEPDRLLKQGHCKVVR
jgi:hypothetical protein